MKNIEIMVEEAGRDDAEPRGETSEPKIETAGPRAKRLAARAGAAVETTLADGRSGLEAAKELGTGRCWHRCTRWFDEHSEGVRTRARTLRHRMTHR